MKDYFSILVVGILLFKPLSLMACSPVVIREHYTHIIKMNGKKNQKIEYLEGIGWIRYKGEEDFTILDGERNVIATITKASLCIIRADGKKACALNSNGYIDIVRLNEYFVKNKTFKTYLKIGNEEPNKYVFKKIKSRDNEFYQSQRMLAAVKSCEELGG